MTTEKSTLSFVDRPNLIPQETLDLPNVQLGAGKFLEQLGSGNVLFVTLTSDDGTKCKVAISIGDLIQLAKATLRSPTGRISISPDYSE